MRPIKEIIIHCTATPEGREVTIGELRRWHRQRGFSDVGYHYIIHLDGRVEAGRAVEEAGAHCQGHNRASIGVCYIGGVGKDGKTPKDTRTEAQKASLARLTERLLRLYPGAEVLGHNQLSAKACPSFDVQKWLKGEYKTWIQQR